MLQEEGAAVLREAVAAVAGARLASDPAESARESPEAETLFARAYESEFPHVYGYIRYRVGSADAADDLTSQTFLKALDRLSTFDSRKSEIGPWMLGIARNVVRDHLRARRRWGFLPLDWLRERASTDPSPEQGAIRSEQERHLLQALGVLSERERDVVGLKFGADLTNRAIAGLTGLGESHVGVIVYRAVGKLRAWLDDEEVRRA
jgi:RNA polymerase sigma factor (sigma-70 family)